MAGTKSIKICQQCGVTFEPKGVYGRSREKAKFCTRTCRDDARRLDWATISATQGDLCQCGCGGRTPTTCRSGEKIIKRHRMYISGHQNRGRFSPAIKTKYRRININGNIYSLHRLRAEAALGHPLPEGAVVHHANGTTSDDSPLVICQDQAYHLLLHARMRDLALRRAHCAKPA